MFHSEETNYSDNEDFTSEQVSEIIFIVITCVLVIGGNLLVIVTIATSVLQKGPLDYYLLSLALSDFFCGMFVLPLSVQPAIQGRWIYGDLMCRISAYLNITLWSITVYTFMWISVDRYLAIRKPLRYDIIQTNTRCQCWIIFTWITSILLFSPPFLGFPKANYHEDGYICTLNLKFVMAYAVTISILVLAPSIITVIYSYFFIFLTIHRLRKYMTPEEKEYATATNENISNPDHIMSFLLTIVFWISWTPWIVLKIWEEGHEYEVQNHPLQFALLWFGTLNGVWKPFIYVSVSPKFRLALKFMFRNVFCRWKLRHQMVI